MIKCDFWPNHRICKNQKSCELQIPVTAELSQLYDELSWELQKLKDLKQRKQQYFEILSQIQQEVYTEIIFVGGNFKRVPKLNVRGEYILKPEDVQVGLNYNEIILEIKNIESIIRELRRKENNILKILKKRVDKYD